MSSHQANNFAVQNYAVDQDSPLESTSQENYPLSKRWWAVLTSPIIIFSFFIATYSYVKANTAAEIMALNSVNILVLIFWCIISYRSLKSPFITLSKNEIIIKDFLGGQTQIVNWDEIDNIHYDSKRLIITTKRCESIPIPKRFLTEYYYEALYSRLRNELIQRKSSEYKLGRYGVVTNGFDAYVTYDCFGTFQTISDLSNYLKQKKATRSIRRTYICINGTRKRFIFRITERNLNRAINDARQTPPISLDADRER